MSQYITRRAFFAGSAVAVSTTAVCRAATPAETDYPYESGQVHVGLLKQLLHAGSRALVSCPNPYHPGCSTEYIVYAGKFCSPLQPWPVGHPVAFSSIDGKLTTIGW